MVKSYRFLVFDGVVLKRKTGLGAVKRTILVVLGITPEGNKEIIDFRVSHADSQAAWEIVILAVGARAGDAPL